MEILVNRDVLSGAKFPIQNGCILLNEPGNDTRIPVTITL